MSLADELRAVARRYGGDCRSNLLRAANTLERDARRCRSLGFIALLLAALIPWAAIAGAWLFQ